MKNRWNWDFIGIFLGLALFWFLVILFLTSCSTRKRTSPCKQCPQYSFQKASFTTHPTLIRIYECA
jgi:hypothetical protein